MTREEALAHGRCIAAAVDIPVSADLEKGFGDAPEDAALTIRLAGEAGLVGGSIEDASGDPSKPIYEANLAAERIAAAADAARALPFAFTLTARAENFLHGKADLDDTIRRLRAFEEAGADVLFAPGLPDLAAVRAVCAAVSKPVNFMVGIRGKSFTVAELEAAGVRRISFATSLFRAAMGGMMEAGKEILERGTFTYLDRAPTTAEVSKRPRMKVADPICRGTRRAAGGSGARRARAWASSGRACRGASARRGCTASTIASSSVFHAVERRAGAGVELRRVPHVAAERHARARRAPAARRGSPRVPTDRS